MITTINYNTSVDAKGLRIGNPVLLDETYATITELIKDEDRRRTIIKVTFEDGTTPVHIIDWGTEITVGTVVQYGVDRPDRDQIMPIHLNHGELALSKAHAAADRYGGFVVSRWVIPDQDSLTGGTEVTEWKSL